MSHTDGVAKVTISLPRDLLALADAARGDEPRSTWIARTLAAALGAVDERIEPASRGGRKRADLTSSVPQRAPSNPDVADFMREFR